MGAVNLQKNGYRTRKSLRLIWGVMVLFKIIDKKRLNDSMTWMTLEAPLIAKKVKPGQFIILRIDEKGERIPLTVADFDREKGLVSIIFQKVGLTTMRLDELEVGESIQDFVGPLGRPTELEGYHKAAVIGGGAGCAIAYPQAKALHNMGVDVDVIAGFRNKDIIILEDEMDKVSNHLYVMTDDGSNGNKGFVTVKLEELLKEGADYDLVIAIGPMPMMRAVCEVTKKWDIKTIVSLNPIMIDGTGMCGGCRVKVGGEMKFACVDGPDFDGHQVDFEEAMRRLSIYKDQEKRAVEDHKCKLGGFGHHA